MFVSMARVTLAIFLFLKIRLFFFCQSPVSLVLLVFVDEVTGSYNLQASEDDHGGELLELSFYQ
jgi:hypothetical protein